MTREVAQAVAQRAMRKGDVLAVARVAGIQAAKRASELIPLCHPLMVNSVAVSFEVEEGICGGRGAREHG